MFLQLLFLQQTNTYNPHTSTTRDLTFTEQAWLAPGTVRAARGRVVPPPPHEALPAAPEDHAAVPGARGGQHHGVLHSGGVAAVHH